LTRLEEHRTAFVFNKGVGPLLRIDQLSHEEIDLVNAEFFARMRLRPEGSSFEEMYREYAASLGSWGIMCPHPLGFRLYDGSRDSRSPLPFSESRWYSCRLCSTAVINR